MSRHKKHFKERKALFCKFIVLNPPLLGDRESLTIRLR